MVRVLGWILRRQAPADDGELLARLRLGGAGTEAPDHVQKVGATQRAIVIVQRVRNQELRIGRPPERRRQHAGHLVRLAIQHHLASDDRAVRPEHAAPQPVAQQHLSLPAGRVLVRPEVAAERRRHSEDAQESVRDARPVYALRLRRAGQVEHDVPVRRHIGEGRRLAAPIVEVRRRDRPLQLPLSWALLGQRQDRRGIREGQRPPQHGVDDAEDRGVGPDTERQHQHGDGREPGLTTQQSDRESEILPDGVDHLHAPGRLVRDRRQTPLANRAFPRERARDARRLPPGRRGRAPAGRSGLPRMILREVAGDRVEEVARHDETQQRFDAARQPAAHASSRRASKPRHSAMSARRLSRSASTPRGRSA